MTGVSIEQKWSNDLNDKRKNKHYIQHTHTHTHQYSPPPLSLVNQSYGLTEQCQLKINQTTHHMFVSS